VTRQVPCQVRARWTRTKSIDFVGVLRRGPICRKLPNCPIPCPSIWHSAQFGRGFGTHSATTPPIAR